ncbi:MAG: OmpA family protein [Nitrospirae bacterium]|nr:OmpA family protein [Nitrospirota bacterium]
MGIPVLFLFLLGLGRPGVAGEASGATQNGVSGLARTSSGSRLPAGASLLKIESGYFTAKNFMLEGYDHRSIDWTLSYTRSGSAYSMFERFEFGLAVEGRSDVIRPPEDAKRSNGYFGDTTIAVKGALLRGSRLDFSLLASATTSAPAQQGRTGISSISPTVLAAGSVDLSPIHFHLNLGTYWDRSAKSLDRDIRTLTRPFRFAQGSYVESSWLMGVGAEARFKPISAFVDLFTFQDFDGKSLGSSFADDTSDRLARERIGFAENPIWLTPGVRVPLASRWQVEAAADLGFLSGDFPGPEDQEILPPWRAIVALAYFTGMPEAAARSRVAADGRGGEVRGAVVDAATGEAIEGAAVFVSGDPDARVTIPGGHFEAGPLSPGKHSLKAEYDGYEPAEKTVEVSEGQKLQITLALEKPKTKPVEVAAVQEIAPEPVKSEPEPAEEAAQNPPVEIARLEPRPSESAGNSIFLTEKIPFKFDRAAIDPSYYSVLDELARQLAEHPDVILRVVGHTDETGSSGLNKWVSLQRAVAIVDYLASKGVDRKRLVPVAMGHRRPIAPNTDRVSRMQNRRADFDPFTPAPWHVEFGYDQVSLPEGAAAVLDDIVNALNAKPEFNVNITGHSDSLGTVRSNMRVSMTRAKAAANGLSKRGVPESRMKVTGMGDLEPVSSNADAAGRSLNRRVDFHLYQPQPTLDKITTN